VIDDDSVLASAGRIVVFHEGAGRVVIESREQPLWWRGTLECPSLERDGF
jgi:hypothetical protein